MSRKKEQEIQAGPTYAESYAKSQRCALLTKAEGEQLTGLLARIGIKVDRHGNAEATIYRIRTAGKFVVDLTK